jgi:hypothetical protein
MARPGGAPIPASTVRVGGGERWLRSGVVLAVVGAALTTALASVATASASQLIDRSASDVHLAVDGKGEALVSYRSGGRVRHVLAWGAVGAVAPNTASPQTRFRLDYAGGWGRYHRSVAASFRDRCGAYDGPPLAWLVAACTAPDGSYWALQAWQRMLPNYGGSPRGAQGAWELRLSHWSGPLAVLRIGTDWSWHRWDHLFGTLTYRGAPVFGFRSSPSGNPLDSFGRNVYVDTYDSSYGVGWKRENSFLTHTGTGAFCYSFNPHGPHPAGKGTRYRATVEGPGVTPDVLWQGTAPGEYERPLDLRANLQIDALHDRLCRPN